MNTRAKILFEAEEQFIKRGIAETQIKEIAEAIGISRRTVYRYYATKDELAFAIEMIVMKQITEYFNELAKAIDKSQDGISQMRDYFVSVDLTKIHRQVRFTAEFDRYFQDDYPGGLIEEDFIKLLIPENDQIYHMIKTGQEDDSIRSDLTVLDIYQFISQSFLSLFQRLMLREKHLKYEFCENVDFEKLFVEIIIRGIQN